MTTKTRSRAQVMRKIRREAAITRRYKAQVPLWTRVSDAVWDVQTERQNALYDTVARIPDAALRRRVLDEFELHGDARSLLNAVLELFGRVRSEERRVGKECMVQCRSRWSPYH